MTALIMSVRIDIAIDTARCAEAGLLLVGITHYDAILSDVRMPGLDGLRLVRECKRLRPNTPVVLVTGYGDQDVETKALHLGAYAFIHKPVQPDVLLSLIDRAIQRTNESKLEGHRTVQSPIRRKRTHYEEDSGDQPTDRTTLGTP